MTVLILDDEITAIEYLQNNIDWHRLGIDTVLQAQNIETAKQTFLTTSIEILLCDIEMPSGNGIEFIEWVHDRHYHSVNIFVTCHDEFKFAQKAIALGAFSYLLKPVSMPELYGVLDQAILKYKESTFMEQLNQLKTHTGPGSSVISRYPWHTILTASNDNISNLIDMDHAPRFSAINIFTGRQNDSGTEIPANFREQLCDLLEAFTADYAAPLLQLENRSYLLLIMRDETLSHEQLDLFCHSVIKRFGTDTLLHCVFRQSLSMTQVNEFFHESISLSMGNVFLDSQIIDLSLFLSQSEAAHDVMLPDMNSLLVMLLRGDFVSMQLLINEWEYKCAINGAISKQHLAAFRLMYEEMLFRLAAEYDIDLKEHGLHDIFETMSDPLADLPAFHHYLHVIAIKLYERIRLKHFSGSVIDQIHHYIHEHYMEDISMDDISGHVGMNKDYLTRLYKQYDSGNTPLSYLLHYRLEQANKLLANPSFSISEIAAMTGFNSQSYFCKVYKSRFQMSPKEFRKNAGTSLLPRRS